MKMIASLLLLANFVAPSLQFFFGPNEPQASPRLFGFNNSDTSNTLTLNRTLLGNAAGIVLASTFFTAAILANLPEELRLENIRKKFRRNRNGSTHRADDEDIEENEAPACDCEAKCYDEYLRGYYDSYEAHFGQAEETGRVKRA